MDKRIGIIANDIEMKALIEEMYPEEVASGEFYIDILEEERMEHQAGSLEEKGVNVIIARGGPYRHAVGVVEVPIVHMKITAADILQALKEAMETGKIPVLVIWDQVFFDSDLLQSFVASDLIVERFDKKGEIHEIIDRYARNKEEYVIIASGIGSKLAREYEMDFVFLNATKNSIHDSVNYARRLQSDLFKEKYRNEVLKTILDGVHDAVIAIDSDGYVIRYNNRARELLKKASSKVMGERLVEVFPGMDFMVDVLETHQDIDNGIRKINQLTIAANVSLIVVDKAVEGVLCAFQDITRLQSLEKKIRYELNKKGLTNKYNFKDIIHEDETMKKTVDMAKKIGTTDSTVVLYGESGTGKEMIAQSIHGISDRHHAPFVAVNCAAISESLLESELFGYEEGAFTGARKGGKPGLFELAHGGSVFLDEISSMSFALQAKLLRVLEEKEVMRLGSDYVIPLDIRVIVATNEDLRDKVREGAFRADLFYRLSILELNIPPLRTRKKDILPVFKHLLSELGGSYGVDHMKSGDMEKLQAYDWPGNVRELRNIAKRFSLFGELELESDLGQVDLIPEGSVSEKRIDLKEITGGIEQSVIQTLLDQGLTKTEVADLLGLSRTALWKKMNKE